MKKTSAWNSPFCMKFTLLHEIHPCAFCTELLSCQGKKWKNLIAGLEHLSDVPFRLILSRNYIFSSSGRHCVVIFGVSPGMFTDRYWLSVHSCCCDWSPQAVWDRGEEDPSPPLPTSRYAVRDGSLGGRWVTFRKRSGSNAVLLSGDTWWNATCFLPVSIFKIIKLSLRYAADWKNFL